MAACAPLWRWPPNGSGFLRRWRRGLRAGRAVLQRNLARERAQRFLWLPVFFGLGIAIGFQQFFASPAVVLAGLLFAAPVLYLLGARRGLAWHLPLCFVLLGLAALQLRLLWVAAPVLTGGPVAVMLEGEILASEQSAKGPRVLLRPARITPLNSGRTLAGKPEKLRLLLPKSQDLPEPGRWLAGKARLLPPPLPAAPGDYNFARVAYFQGLGAVGFSLGAPRIFDRQVGRQQESAPPAGGPSVSAASARWPGQISWQLLWNRLRWRVIQRVRAQLPPEHAGLAIALSVGARGYLPAQQVGALRDSGLAHLLAISGLHIGLVAGSLYFLVRAGLALIPAVALSYPIKKWAAVVAWLGAFVYFGLSGGSVPTERAFIMVSLSLLAILADRRAISLRVLAWAALLVLLLRPESLLTASFQLSFAAVAALIAAYEAVQRGGAMQRLLEGREPGGPARLGRGLVLFFAGLAGTSLVAGLATAPLALFHFQQIASFGLLANMIAIPLASFVVMPLIILSLLLMPFQLEPLVLPWLGAALQALLALAGEISSWPGAVQRYSELPLWGALSAVAAGAWLCLWRGSWRYAALPFFLILPLSIALHRGPDVRLTQQEPRWALRGPDGRLLLPLTAAGQFSADQWIKRSGLPPRYLAPGASLSLSFSGRTWLRCDPLACRFSLDPQRSRWTSLLRDPRGLEEDCRTRQRLLSFHAVGKGCKRAGAEVLLDANTLARQGGTLVWLDDRGARSLSLKTALGNAPWGVNAPWRRRSKPTGPGQTPG